VLGILFTWRTAGRLRWEIGYFVTATLAALFVSSVWAPPLWEMPLLGGLLQSAQFPWRWLVIATLGVSVLAALIGQHAVLRK
jgi:hypothetical protein